MRFGLKALFLVVTIVCIASAFPVPGMLLLAQVLFIVAAVALAAAVDRMIDVASAVAVRCRRSLRRGAALRLGIFRRPAKRPR